MTRKIRGGAEVTRRLTRSGDICDAAKRKACGDDRGDRDADDHESNVDPTEREVTWGQRCPRKGDVIEQRSDQEEQSEPERLSRHSSNRRLYS